MERITERRLDQLVAMISEELRWGGFIEEATQVVFDKGSRTYGRAFRIYTVGNGGGYSDKPLYLGDGFLGLTRREAWLSLRAILRTLEAVRHSTKEVTV
jgi:hypothetical protein